MSDTPIGDHALLSDRHTTALVDRAGTVTWLCLPRFDSPSVFAALLDDAAGSWTVRPAGDPRRAAVSRRYLPGTMALETTFETGTGTLVLTDALALRCGRDLHRLGADAPHLLVRTAACTGGAVDVEVRLRARPEYGLAAPRPTPVPGGLRVAGGAGRLTLSAPVPFDLRGETATATARLRAGETLRLGLHWTRPGAPSRIWTAAQLDAWLAETLAAWRGWSRLHQGYQGTYQEAVQHSGRVLQALSHQPTGAIVAAATTSLPEEIGGERNWDYRYSWVRDASLTLNALWVAACPDEAADFFSFLADSAADCGPPGTLQIMFGVGGEQDLAERELPWLRGWRDSRPVRIGNGAWRQTQLDVYGELLDAALLLADRLAGPDPKVCAFLVSLADAVARHWRRPDHGIWEIRGAPRHYLHSKVMCWAALDRAISLAGFLRAAGRLPYWRRTREEIRRAVLEAGWNDRVRAFTQAFGSAEVDASALMLPIVGFLPADDPRVRATVARITADLVDERGLVHRYRADDGLAGTEGAFLLCTYWLAQALALGGRTARACEVFETATGFANDVGLLAEEVHPGTGELLGNFPQAFSHIGLINAAWAIDQATRGTC